MRKLFFIIITVIFFFALNSIPSFPYEKEIKNLSSTMGENISKAGMRKIAVVDFVDLQGNITELGRFVAEELSVALAGSRKGFRLVDRVHLKAILKEHKLVITGIVDPTTAKKLGQISGADALVTGTITPFGDSVRLAAKVLDTASGDIIDASSTDIAKTKAIEELLSRGIDSSAAPATRESTSTPQSAPGSAKPIEAGGFVFKPVKCLKKGDILVCSISLLNIGDEQIRVQIKGNRRGGDGSYITDNIGSQYPLTLQIGNRQDSYAVWENILPQTPVNVNFISKDVNPIATHVTVVISISKSDKKSRSASQHLVAVKNIPITK